ncbi:amidase [Caballeronia sordidicola]|nr:amidase [Caballeronia sordidicola]
MPIALPRSAYRSFVPYPKVDVEHASNGSLSGLTFGVKDLFDVAGYPTGCGNPHMLAMSGVKSTHAFVVEQLLEAGAELSGKTYTDELAFSMIGKNVHFGMPSNGAAPDRITGGSSSGSASAVSNHLCDFAIGTDTGGSIRAPASNCGVFGLRPTHGKVSLDGCMALSPSLDTGGWLARDSKTLARVGKVLLGMDSGALTPNLEILTSVELADKLSDEVAAVFFEMLVHVSTRLDAKVRRERVSAMPIDEVCSAFRYIQGYEAWESHGSTIETYDLQLGETVRDRFSWSRSVTHEQSEASRVIRSEFRTDFVSRLSNNKVLAIPTMPSAAPLISADENTLDTYRANAIRMLCVSSLSGCPQISMPLMLIEGAPLGFSLIGPPGSDTELIALAGMIL